jgi:hypothetical protein
VAQRQSKALHRHNDWSGETIAETQRRLRGEGESLSDLKAQLAEALEAQRRSDDLASLLTARASHDELNRDQFTAPQLYCVRESIIRGGSKICANASPDWKANRSEQLYE